MNDDRRDDGLSDWVGELLARVETEDIRIRISDAVTELRASRYSDRLAHLDNGELADLIEDSVSMFQGFGVLGERGNHHELIDPANAWVSTTAAIVHRRKLSHRITAEDVADRILPFDEMLGALDADIPGGDHLYDGRGEPLERHVGGKHDVAVPGWVDGFDEGRLSIVWREGKTLHIDVIDDDDLESDGAAELAALRAWFDEGAANGLGRELAMGVFDLIHDSADSFMRTTPPIDELLLANGFVGRRGWWGPADSAWQTPGEQLRAARLATVAQRYGLAPHAEKALDQLDEIWRAWSGFHNFSIGDLPEIDVAEIRELFEIELVPLAFFDLTGTESSLVIGGQNRDAEKTPLGMLADKVAQGAPDSVAALLLTGRSHEVAGRARAGEQAYREAARRYETNVTALAKCMEAAVDASRFDEAARLTQRLFGPGSANESVLRSYADAMITAERNDPCPCGSGRKYKQCHKNVPVLPEPYATRSLIFKLEMFAERMVLTDALIPGQLNSLAADLIGHPEPRDFMIHEGRMLDRYLETRIDLIPPNELERLRSWQIGDRGLYEITEVDPGHGMTLRNVATGEHCEIVERMGSADAKIGQYVLLRLETVDGVTTSYGQGTLVPAAHRSRVLDLLDDGEIEGLLDWYADLLAPPELTTTDGDALVLCTALISASASVKDLGALLDEEFGKGSPENGPAKDREWTATHEGVQGQDSVDEGSSVLASIRIVNKRVELSTMSEERHEHFVAVLLDILPDAELVEERIEPIDMAAIAREAESMVDADGLFADDEPSDEMREIMEKHLLQLEANWLHESVPALAGLTPLEALDDPTRRPDLIRLLNTMPSNPNGFNADRLRAALGLG